MFDVRTTAIVITSLMVLHAALHARHALKLLSERYRRIVARRRDKKAGNENSAEASIISQVAKLSGEGITTLGYPTYYLMHLILLILGAPAGH